MNTTRTLHASKVAIDMPFLCEIVRNNAVCESVHSGLLVAVQEWYSAQLSGPHSHDMCGIDQNDQRRHLATERLLQECRKMWGDQ